MQCKFPYCKNSWTMNKKENLNINKVYCSAEHRETIITIKKSIRDNKYFEYFKKSIDIQKAYHKLKSTYKIKWE